MNEIAVIRLARQGNKEALRLLFEENKKKIFSLAYQYVKNAEDAEDILQETFIKVYRSLHKLNMHDGTRFSPWLYRIGINCSIDYLRRKKKERKVIQKRIIWRIYPPTMSTPIPNIQEAGMKYGRKLIKL